MKRTFLPGRLVLILLLCSTSNVLAVDGWASMNDGTTGGAGGTVVTVETAADFKTYVESNEPYIVQVSGTIYLPYIGGKVSIQSNKTICGIDATPTIIGNLGFFDNATNIIIRGLNITDPYDGDPFDGISVKNAITNIFITHCTFYDCGDGCLDITNGSDYVTVSWCKFYYSSSPPDNAHRFVNLIGADDYAYGDRGRLHVTMHHNWWAARCDQRMPRVRYGQVHVYNNYYGCSGNSYCVGVGVECQIRLENNYFDNVNRPWLSYNTSGFVPGKIGWNTGATGNQFINTTIPTWAPNNYATIFTPPYSYAMDAGANVKGIVKAYAGAPVCFGDFDRSETVDFGDLAELSVCWLDTDSPDEVDYDSDGMVNFREFVLLADNWGKTDFVLPSAPKNLTANSSDSMVTLNWDDNIESDLAGYNLYRSTTYGGGYVRLNDLPVSSSDYVDNTAANGMIYYYIVRALDTSSHQSIYSNEVLGMPLDAGTIIIQEGTAGFCGVDGIINTMYPGYTGSGYCYTVYYTLGDGIDWSISVPVSGTYTFTWRYALIGDRPAKLLVNSSEIIPSLSFPDTGNWTTWSSGVSVETSLTAGTNNIRLEAITTNGLANIDYIMVTGDNPQPAGCP